MGTFANRKQLAVYPYYRKRESVDLAGPVGAGTVEIPTPQAERFSADLVMILAGTGYLYSTPINGHPYARSG